MRPSDLLDQAMAFMASYRQVNWALSDQAMVSGANFLTNIILVRYLGLEEYGRYILAWIAIDFVRILHEPLVIAPMVTIGPKRTGADAEKYYSVVSTFQLTLCILLSLLLVGVVALLNIYIPSWNLDGLAPIMGFAAITYHFQEFCRRCAFAKHRPHLAFASDAVRYLGQMVIIIAFAHYSTLDAREVILITAITALAGIGFALPVLFPIKIEVEIFKDALVRHWDFGKWFVPSVILARATADIFMAVTGAIIGAAAVGALKAARNIVAVTHILLMGLENVVPIRAAQRYAEAGTEGLVVFLKRFGIASCGAVAVLILMVAIVPEFWLELFYGEQHIDQGYLVQWWGAFYFMTFLARPAVLGLRAMEYTRPIFTQNLIVALIGLSACYPVIKAYGVTGVVVGLTLLGAFRVIFISWTFARYLRTRKASDPASGET